MLATVYSRPVMLLLDCMNEFKTMGLEEVVLVHVNDVRAQGDASAYGGFEQEMLESQKNRLESTGLKVKMLKVSGAFGINHDKSLQ